MEKKIGKLEKVKRFGILRDLEIIVDGQKFYERIKCEGIPKDIKNKIGKIVIVQYEEITTPFSDWIIDMILFNIGNFKPSRCYNQIKMVMSINDIIMKTLCWREKIKGLSLTDKALKEAIGYIEKTRKLPEDVRNYLELIR